MNILFPNRVGHEPQVKTHLGSKGAQGKPVEQLIEAGGIPHLRRPEQPRKRSIYELPEVLVEGIGVAVEVERQWGCQSGGGTNVAPGAQVERFEWLEQRPLIIISVKLRHLIAVNPRGKDGAIGEVEGSGIRGRLLVTFVTFEAQNAPGYEFPVMIVRQ